MKTLLSPTSKQSNSRSHHGPLTSYPTLTELTRNPPSTRSAIEKNWLLFFPSTSSAYIHYDLSSTRRTFAKLLGSGYTTPNLTDPSELPCLTNQPDSLNETGTWHQASNSLRLILCYRHGNNDCDADGSGSHNAAVFFAAIHRKFSNPLHLPLRYERFFVVWDAKPPFHMLAVSKHPILLYNETASGWSPRENWEDVVARSGGSVNNSTRAAAAAAATAVPLSVLHPNKTIATNFATLQHNTTGKSHPHRRTHGQTPEREQRAEGRDNWASFTYTTSIAWAWHDGRTTSKSKSRHHTTEGRRAHPAGDQEDGQGSLADMNTGYLDDEVILGIGVDDHAQGFARVPAESLLQCMRACPSVTG